MIYKIYEGLSDYLIAPDGTPVHKASGEVIKFTKSKVGFAALLKTDEVFSFVRGKKIAIRLNRRFTRADLLAMFQKSKHKAVFDDSKLEINHSRIQLRSMSEHEMSTSLAKLEKPVGTWIEEAGEITQHQMDQLAASKRTVKANPKAKKSTVAKISKAIKNAEVEKPLKVPYFEINGQKYQSARKASEAVGVSVNTVLKKAKMNKDGWNFIEKE